MELLPPEEGDSAAYFSFPPSEKKGEGRGGERTNPAFTLPGRFAGLLIKQVCMGIDLPVGSDKGADERVWVGSQVSMLQEKMKELGK